jgi:uncharacterized protein
MQIIDFNPWWKSSEVPEELTGRHRNLLPKLISYLDYRQIILLYGIRRAGKTTLMHQLIDHILTQNKIPHFNILYFSFDLQDLSLDQIVEYYEVEILKNEIRSGKPIYFFIDEIQKLDDWANRIKILYDRYPNLKLVLSGSAALPLLKGTKESLAGRFFEFLVKPFSFDEFIAFKGAKIDKERESLCEREIKILLQDFLATGGFIEVLQFDEVALKKYFKESLLERVIFKDIPESFQINQPNLLFRLLNIIARQPGMFLDYKNLGNDLKVDQRTISNYISYLEHSLLINKLYNYSGNQLTSEKKLKRVYPSNTAFINSLSDSSVGQDILLETFYSGLLKARFFFRSPRKEEVDIILDNQHVVLPVEIKIRKKVRASDLKPILKFLERYNCKKALVISGRDERIEKKDNRKVFILPYWKYWSILNISGFVE